MSFLSGFTAVALAAVVAPVIAPVAAQAEPVAAKANCTVHKLNIDGVSASAIDPTGRFIAGTDGGAAAYLWENGRPTRLKLPATVENVGITAVNAFGVVVGQVWLADGNSHAFKYSRGKFTLLPSAGVDSYVAATGINSLGDIVGTDWDFDANRQRALLWRAGTGKATVLEEPPGLEYGAKANDISDTGLIVGTLSDGEHPYVWDRNLKGHIPAENPGLPGGKIFDVNGDWAAGWVSSGGQSWTNLYAARWNLRTGALTVYTELSGAAEGASATGDIVAQPQELSGRSVRVHRGQISELPGGESNWPTGISADGRTIVGDVDNSGAIWRC